MKKIFLFFNFGCLLLLTIVSPVFASHTYVNGYYKSNGTYVSRYARTSPNSTKLDNFSTKGNINPYTSKTGTINLYKNYNTSFSSNYYKSRRAKY